MADTLIFIFVVIGIVVLVLGVRILFTIYYYREMGSAILDMFDSNPFLAWMHYGFTGYFLAQKFGKEPTCEGMDLEQAPSWALSEEEKKQVKGDIWFCPECGMTNPSSRILCSCGASKPK